MAKRPLKAQATIAIALALVIACLTTTDTPAEPLHRGDRLAAVARGVNEPLEDLLRHVEHAHPVAMMFLAKRLFDAGRRDEGVFWFYVAQLRWRALLYQTPDHNGQSHFQRLFEQIGPAINPYAFQDLPAFYNMINAVLAWDAAHHDDFVSSREAKARSRQGLTDLVDYTRAHEDETRARQAELASASDPNDPYGGSGGAMFSTPREMLTPYDAGRFNQFRAGQTTREQVVQRLGGPESWSTDRDGTSSFGYSYAGPTMLGMTRILQVTLRFDARRVLSSVNLPRQDEPPVGPQPQYLRVRQVDGAPGTCRSFAHDGALAGARFLIMRHAF